MIGSMLLLLSLIPTLGVKAPSLNTLALLWQNEQLAYWDRVAQADVVQTCHIEYGEQFAGVLAGKDSLAASD